MLGSATLVGVEFRGLGVKGYTTKPDQRFAVIFSGLGDDGIDSVIEKCTIVGSATTALAISDTNKISVKWNVIYYAVGSGMTIFINYK